MSHRSPCVDGCPLHWHLLFSLLLMTGSIAEAQFTTVVNVPPDLPPISITSGTQLNILEGGQVGTSGESFSAHGGEVNLLGGSVGHFAVLTDGAHLNMQSGSIGQSFSLTNGSSAIIHNGTIGSSFYTQASSITIGGGQFGGVTLGFDSVATINGGIFDQGVHVNGSDVTIHDATIHTLMRLAFQSTVDIYGGSFPENILVQEGSQLNLYGGTLNKRLNVGGSSRPSGEATANIYAGEVDMQWSVGWQGVVNVHDGTLKSHGEVSGGVLNVHGGTVGDHLEVLPQGTLNLDGGKLGDNTVLDGTTLITGGQIGAQLQIGGTATIYGGTIGPEMAVVRSGVVNIHGGTFGDAMHIDGDVTIYATSFELDVLLAKGRGLPKDTPVEELLVYDHPYRLRLDEDATLIASLEDGSPFELNLFRSPIAGHDFLDQGANISLVLVRVPEPATILLGLLLLPLGGLVRRANGARRAFVRLPVRLALFIALPLPVDMARGQFTTVINLPGDPPPTSITAGTQLNMAEGAHLGAGTRVFTAYGGEVNVAGGTIDATYTARGDATTNITEGHFVYQFILLEMSHATISDGLFDGALRVRGSEFQLRDHSMLEMSGGEVHSPIEATGDAQLTISGGRVLGVLNLRDRAHASVSGGLFAGADHVLLHESSLLLKGADFRIDGVPVAGLSTPGTQLVVQLEANQFLSATLADGSPFVFRQQAGMQPLTLQLAPPPPAPTLLTVPSDIAPLALRDGQTLNLGPGGELGSHFVAGWNSTLNVSGGEIGPTLGSYGARVNISRGTIGDGFHSHRSTVSIEGGTFENVTFTHGSIADIAAGSFNLLRVERDAMLTLRGGEANALTAAEGHIHMSGGHITGSVHLTAESSFTLEGGLLSGPLTILRTVSDVHLRGGTVDGPISVGQGGGLHIHGGNINGALAAQRQSDLTLHGTHFSLPAPTGDGPEIDLMSLLEPGIPYLLDIRDTTLSATLADGSPFELNLLTTSTPGRDFVHADARLYLVLVAVPEPATAVFVLVSLVVVAVLHYTRRAAC